MTSSAWLGPFNSFPVSRIFLQGKMQFIESKDFFGRTHLWTSELLKCTYWRTKNSEKTFCVIYTFDANRKIIVLFFYRFIRTKDYVALITWPENPYSKIMLFSFFFRSWMAHVLIRFAFRVYFALTRLDAKLQWNWSVLVQKITLNSYVNFELKIVQKRKKMA